MSKTDLTKMVEEARVYQFAWGLNKLDVILKAFAAEIEANREEIKRLKLYTVNQLGEEIEKLKAELRYCQRIKPEKGVNQ